MANLITAKEVIELAFAENSNMREESISDTSIRIAEIKYIRPAFGAMYPLLADKYAGYTNDYVKPALAYFVKCEIVSSIAIDMSNSGVAVANPQYQSAATDKQRQRLYDSEMSKAKTLLDFALEYIATHSEEFPDFSGEAPKKHHRVGGILLGGGTSRSQAASIAGEAFKNEFERLTKNVAGKVDKVEGKGLSTNDFTDEYKQKVDEISGGGGGNLTPPTTQIWYTSVDSAIVEPFAIDVFGANIVSNTYENGKGVISFDGDVTKIGQDAFLECDKLTSVAIPDSVTEIGDRAFNKCYTLLNFRNSANLKSIGLLAFGICFSLKDITIPEGVVSIGERAFISCRSLISITIPSSVTEIGTRVVKYCDSLATINSNLNDGRNNLLIANGVLLGVAPKSTLGFTIPSSVTEIGAYAFSDCSTLKGITIPDSVKKIGGNAFNGCYSLTSITIPSSVTEIGDRAFYGCRSLESVTIGSNVSSIGKEAFSGCAGHLFLNSVPYENYTATAYPLLNGWLLGSKFTKITIGSGISKIGTNTFYGYTGELEIASNKLLETDYTSTTIPSDTGWLSGVLSPKITVGYGISKIGSRVFAILGSLEEVVLPNSVTEIREYAFNRCSSLQKITFGTRLTTIGNAAFKACGFTSLHIPDSVTSIGRFAFDNCSNLEKILLPNNSATTISGEAFYTTLKVLCSTSETPPTLTSALTVHKNCLVVVPKDYLDAYKKATNWSAKADAEKMVGSELIDYFDNELFWVLVRMELKIQNSILGGMLG